MYPVIEIVPYRHPVWVAGCPQGSTSITGYAARVPGIYPADQKKFKVAGACCPAAQKLHEISNFQTFSVKNSKKRRSYVKFRVKISKKRRSYVFFV